MSNSRISKTTYRRVHHSGEEVEIPVAHLTGARPGPTFAVMAGMHGGEYAGVLAAQRLIQTVDPDDLRGSLIVIPVISTEAFKMRSIQLSPVDGREAHYHVPGNPEGSYTARLLDDDNLRLKKLGEETAELVTALARSESTRIREEAADLLYHLLVALLGAGVELSDVLAVLQQRRR